MIKNLIKNCKLCYILRRSDIKNPTFDRTCFGCRIFDIRRTADRMSKIWHPKKRTSDVEYSAFDGRSIESKKPDPTNKANRIEFAIFDPTECTRLVGIHFWWDGIV